MKKELIDFLKKNLTTSYLQDFGIKKQFIELKFVSEVYDEIMFFIDCRIFSTNSKVNNTVELLKEGCVDTFEIGYFIFVNNKSIIDVKITEKGNLLLLFSNELSIIFDLNSVEYFNIAITFREKKSSDYVSIIMNGELDFQMSDVRYH